MKTLQKFGLVLSAWGATFALTAQAQTNFWWTNNANGVWSLSNGWTNNTGVGAPAVGGSNDYSLVFQNTSSVALTNNLGAPGFVLNKVQFSGANALTLFGGATTNLIFTNNNNGVMPQVVQASASNITLNMALLLATNLAFTGSGVGTVTVNSNIAGPGMLTMGGTYMLTLSASNSYTGGTLISNGILRIASTVTNTSTNTVLGSGNVTILSGGSLDLTGVTTVNSLYFANKTFTIAGNGYTNSGAIFNNSAVTQINAFQQIVLAGNASIGGSQRFDIRGGVATLDLASNTLTKIGSGYVGVVGGLITAGNIVISNGTFSIQTSTVCTGSYGTITVHTGGALDFYSTTAGKVTRPIRLNGGSITVGAAAVVDSPILLTSNGTVNISSGNLTLNGGITESNGFFGLTKLGSSTLILANTSSYSGGTVINSGNLQFNSLAAVPASGNILINSGGVLNATGAYMPDAWLGSGRIDTNSAGTFALTANNSAALDFAGTGYNQLFLGASGTATNSGVITPANNVYRLGGGGGTLVLANNLALTGNRDVLINNLGVNGTVVLLGSNDFSGNVSLVNSYVGAATVASIYNSAALGKGSILFTNTGANGANYLGVNFYGGSGSLVITNPITIDSTTAGRMRFVSVTGSNVITSPITLKSGGNNAGFEGSGQGYNGSWTILGDIDGTQLNGGSLYLSGTNTGAGASGGSVLGSIVLGAGSGILMEKGGGIRSEWSIGAPGKTYTWSFLRVNGLVHLLTSGVLPTNSWLESTHNSDMNVDLNGTTQQVVYINTSTFNGNVITNYSTRPSALALVGTAASRSIFTGTIADGLGGGTISLALSGGSLNLIGANTYSGGTLVTNGAMLVVSGTNSFGTGALAIGADVGIGSTNLDQTFLNWVVTKAGVAPLVALVGGASANSLAFTGALANTFLGSAGGVNAYNGTATWADNNLRLGGGSSNLIYVPTIGAGSNLLIGPVGGNVYSVVILTNAANTPDSTVIQSGTLQLGNSTTGAVVIGNNAIAISNNATLAFKFNGGTGTYVNVITGGGRVSQQGTASIFLTSSNDYSGGTFLSAAGRLGVGDDHALGTGPITVTAAGYLTVTGTTPRVLANSLVVSNNFTLGTNINDTGTLTINGPVDLCGTTRQLTVVSPVIFGGVISNGGLTKAGASTLVLGGSNVYTLGTTLSAGTLSISDYPNLSSAGPVTFSGGILQITGTSVTNLAPYAINWTNFSGGLDVADVALALPITNNLVATGTFTKLGEGNLVWSGTNTFSQVIVNGGVMTFLPGSSNVVGSDFRIGNAIGVTGTVNQIGGYVSASLGNGLLLGGVGGTGTYTLDGGGTLNALMTGGRGVMLSVNNNCTGTFNLVNGTLNANQLQAGRTDAAATNSVGYYYQTGGTATVAALGIAGMASSVQVNGRFVVSNGTFVANSWISLARGNFSTGQVYIGQGALVTLPAFPTNRGTSAYADITFDGGTLSPLASSTTYMQGLDKAYITANGATFNVGSAISITVSQNLENAAAAFGGLTKTGPGTLILAGSNTFSGGVNLQQGSLLFGSASSLPAGTGSLLIPYGAAAGVGFAVDQAFFDSLVMNLSSGTFGLGANNGNPLDFSGVANISLGAIGGTWTNTGDLTFYGDSYNLGGGNGTLVIANVLSDRGSATGLRAFSSGTGGIVVLAATNTYTGPTTLMGGGAVSIGSYSNLPLASALVFNGGLLQVTGTAVSNLNPYTVNWSGFDGGFDVASNGFAFTVANNITGGGSLTKQGSGTLVLSGVNSYAGPTIINSGILQVGDGGANGTLGTGTVTNNAALVFRRSDVFTNTSFVTGTGGLYQGGSGTLVITNNQSYSGGTYVSSGTLKIGATDVLPVTGAVTLGTNSSAGNLDVSGYSQTIASLAAVSTNAAQTNVITIGAAQTLSITGAGGITLGVDTSVSSPSSVNTTRLTMNGGGALVVTNASAILTIGKHQGTQTNSSSIVTFDLTKLGSVTLGSSNGPINELRIGYGQYSTGTLLLSDTNNTITAAKVIVGHSNGGNAGYGTLIFGAGENVLAVDALQIGFSKAAGTNKFASQVAGSPGTVTIGGKTGVATDITIGSKNGTSTSGSPSSLLDLRGHVANVTAGTVIIAQENGNGAGNETGSLFFASGLFTVSNLNMAVKTTAGGANATATLMVSGGVFSVNAGGSFTLASQTGGGTANGTLNLFGGIFNSYVDILDGGGNATSTINLNGGTLDMNGRAIGSSDIYVDAFNLQSGTLQNLGQFNGGAPLIKTGSGTLVLAGSNTYTGGTVINAGVLVASNAQALGRFPVSISNATLRLAQSLTIDNTLSGLAGAYIDLGSTGTTLTVRQSGNSTFAGSLTNAGALVKSGTGTLLLTGASTFTGGTTINDGTLQLGLDNALPANALAGSTSGRLDLNGRAQTMNNVSGYLGLITNSGAASTFTVSLNNTTQSFGGTFAGATHVTVQDRGQLSLTGSSTAATFSGNVNITNATLRVQGTLTSGGLISVLDGGTLGGTGALGNVTVYTGGVFAPGNSPGLQTLTSLTLNGGTLQADLDNSNSYDRVIVSNALTFTPGVTNYLQLALGNFNLEGGAEYLIVRNDSTLPWDGSLFYLSDASIHNNVALTNNMVFQAMGGTLTTNLFKIQYNFNAPAGDGVANDILLTAIPEPASMNLLALMGLAYGLRRLLRRKTTA